MRWSLNRRRVSRRAFRVPEENFTETIRGGEKKEGERKKKRQVIIRGGE